MSTPHILHLLPAAEWDALAPDDDYAPESVAAEGFIHCTATAEGLLGVANLFYRGQAGTFLVLEIDPARVRAPLRFEPPSPPLPDTSPHAGDLYPHIYGPLNRDAVVLVRVAERAADGTFVSLE